MKKWKLTIEQKKNWSIRREDRADEEMFSWEGHEYIFENFAEMSEFAEIAIATGNVETRAIIEPAQDGESNGN